MKKLYVALVPLMVVMVFTCINPAQSYVYTTVDVSGYTTFTGINDSGQIVGYTIPVLGGDRSSFVLPSINSTPIPIVPFGSSSTTASAINDMGQIVGFYPYITSGYTPNNGFLYNYNSNQVSVYNVPNYNTQFTGINNSGQIVGYDVPFFGFNNSSFVLPSINSTPIPIAPPGSLSTTALGINNLGQIVGNYSNATGTHGFLASPTVYGLFLGFDSSGSFEGKARTDQGGQDADMVMTAFQNYYNDLNMPNNFQKVQSSINWSNSTGGITKATFTTDLTNITSKLQPGDQFILFICGHGGYLTDYSKPEPPNPLPVTGWNSYTSSTLSDIYCASLQNPPRDSVIINNNSGQSKGSIAELTNINDYFWNKSTGTLYVKSSSSTPSVIVDQWPWQANETIILSPNKQYLYDNDLTNLLSGLDPSISKKIILGECYSGGFWLNRNGAMGDLADVPNTALLASAQENGKSGYNSAGWSYFSAALVIGLTKNVYGYYNADANHDGIVTFGELGNYVKIFDVTAFLGMPTLFQDGEEDDSYDPSAPIPFTSDMWNPGYYQTNDFTDGIVPIPSSMIIFGSGLLSLVGWGWFKKS